MGVQNLTQILDEQYYEARRRDPRKLAGCSATTYKLFLYPHRDERTGRVETVDTMQVPEALHHLYRGVPHDEHAVWRRQPAAVRALVGPRLARADLPDHDGARFRRHSAGFVGDRVSLPHDAGAAGPAGLHESGHAPASGMMRGG